MKDDDRSDPFEQLERCHRRLEERLDDLAAASAGSDAAAAADVARDLAAFVARSVRRHEEDEETSLFPRLVGTKELAPALEKLAREHREHERLHAELDAIAERLARDAGADAALADLARVADALMRAYRTHIEEEESQLFPVARRSLDDATKAAIFREMQARRGR